jgi:hypothetical protein
MDWDGVLREPSGFLDSLFLQGERLIRIGGAITTDGFDSVIATHKIGEGSDCWNFFYPA